MDLVAAREGTLDAIALTHVDPDHAAGAEALVVRLEIPVLTGPGGGQPLPYPVRALADMDLLETSDVPVRALLTPGPRPEHTAYLVGDGGFVVTGDLDGLRGARSIPGPTDPERWAASRERVEHLAPDAVHLAGHPITHGSV